MEDLSFAIPGLETNGAGALYVRFENVAEKQGAKSEQEGRPIYETKPYVRITLPGGKSEVCRRATEQDKAQYPREWAAFQNGQQNAVIGTPIEQWAALETSQIATLKALSIMSIEQLAEVSDPVLDKIGMGARDLREKAKTWIKAAKDAGHAVRLQAQNDRLQAEIESLKAQIKEVAAQVKTTKNKAESGS